MSVFGPVRVTPDDNEPAPRSSVKIATNAKGAAQLDVKIYEGTTEEEAQRIKDLALRTYEVGLRELARIAQVP